MRWLVYAVLKHKTGTAHDDHQEVHGKRGSGESIIDLSNLVSRSSDDVDQKIKQTLYEKIYEIDVDDDELREMEQELERLRDLDDNDSQDRFVDLEQEYMERKVDIFLEGKQQEISDILGYESEVVIRISPLKLSKMLEDGRYKTIHDLDRERKYEDESLDVGGWDNPAIRTEFEEDGFDRESPEPVYGYINYPDKPEWINDTLNAYGSIDVVLKPSVRKRTTLTIGDSLGNNVNENSEYKPIMNPSPIQNPSYRSIPLAKNDDYIQKNLKDAIADSSEYIEAQILGGIKLSDIDHIRFADNFRDMDDYIIQELKQKGIRVET